MCRLALYLGPPLRLASIVFEGDHSLVRQSSASQEREDPLNGDGFGVGWYAPELAEDPAVFRSVTPAWNNRNLLSLSRVVRSPGILAHVRAATNQAGVNEANCHPFRFGRYLFAHNGDVGAFPRVRRRLLESVSDEAFGNVYGSTDSELVFSVFIDELAKRRGADLATNMADALATTLRRVVDAVELHGGAEPSYLNIAISDGRFAVASRFTSAPDGAPESLYCLAGRLGDIDPGRLVAREGTSDGACVFVSSERLSSNPGWQEVPPNHIVVIGADRLPRFIPCDEDK